MKEDQRKYVLLSLQGWLFHIVSSDIQFPIAQLACFFHQRSDIGNLTVVSQSVHLYGDFASKSIILPKVPISILDQLFPGERLEKTLLAFRCMIVLY